eukprot:3153882-Amphidinium_carterae.1
MSSFFLVNKIAMQTIGCQSNCTNQNTTHCDFREQEYDKARTELRLVGNKQEDRKRYEKDVCILAYSLQVLIAPLKPKHAKLGFKTGQEWVQVGLGMNRTNTIYFGTVGKLIDIFLDTFDTFCFGIVEENDVVVIGTICLPLVLAGRALL